MRKCEFILELPLSEQRIDQDLFEDSMIMDGRRRVDIRPGLEVRIVTKQDQRTGKLTHGIVQDILTRSSYHSRGIKVRLEDGQVGRVQSDPA